MGVSVRIGTIDDVEDWAQLRVALWPSHPLDDHRADIIGTFLPGNGPETRIDDRSLLEWTVDLQAGGAPKKWLESLEACDLLELAGHDDWRLPSVKELVTLAGADMDAGGNEIVGLANTCWSSSSPATPNQGERAFVVELPSGKFTEVAHNFQGYRLRCVRGPVTALPNP